MALQMLGEQGSLGLLLRTNLLLLLLLLGARGQESKEVVGSNEAEGVVISKEKVG